MQDEFRSRCAALLSTIALLIVAASAPTAEEIVERYDDGSVRARYEVTHGSNGKAVRDGSYESFFPSGQSASKGEYAAGLRDGVWVYRWEAGGERRETGKFRRGERHGRWRGFQEDGKKSYEGAYNTGRRSGQWRFYGDFEMLREKGRYKSGKRVGEWKVLGKKPFQLELSKALRADGTVWSEGAFLDGYKEGSWTYWWPGGQVMAEAEYREGKAHGEWRFYHPDGTFDSDYFSGRFDRGGFVAKLDGAAVEAVPEPDLSKLQSLDVDPESSALVEAALKNEASAESTFAELRAKPRRAFRAFVTQLANEELDTETGRSRASRINALLKRLCGNAYPWANGADESSLRANRMTVLRWHSLWHSIHHRHRFWLAEFRADPPVTWEESVIANPPGPQGIHEVEATHADGTFLFPSDRHSTPPFGRVVVPASGGGNFGRRYGRARLVPADHTPHGVVSGAYRWLLSHQLPDGSWSVDGEPTSGNYEATAAALNALALESDCDAAWLGAEWLMIEQAANPELKGISLSARANALEGFARLTSGSRTPKLMASIESLRKACLDKRDAQGAWSSASSKLDTQQLTATLYVAAVVAGDAVRSDDNQKIAGPGQAWFQSELENQDGSSPGSDAALRFAGSLMSQVCGDQEAASAFLAGLSAPKVDSFEELGPVDWFFMTFAAFRGGRETFRGWSFDPIVNAAQLEGETAYWTDPKTGLGRTQATARILRALDVFWAFEPLSRK